MKNYLKIVQIKMICTNPDLVVDRGNTQEYCAGSIAKLFEKIGGEVVISVNHIKKFIIQF